MKCSLILRGLAILTLGGVASLSFGQYNGYTPYSNYPPMSHTLKFGPAEPNTTVVGNTIIGTRQFQFSEVGSVTDMDTYTENISPKTLVQLVDPTEMAVLTTLNSGTPVGPTSVTGINGQTGTLTATQTILSNLNSIVVTDPNLVNKYTKVYVDTWTFLDQGQSIVTLVDPPQTATLNVEVRPTLTPPPPPPTGK